MVQTSRTNTPPTAGPISWANREYNTGADKICNLILDNNLPTHTYTIDNIQQIIDKRPNLFIQADGACRGGKVSSTGWQIKAISLALERELILAQGGEIIKKGLPSLVVETMALDQAISYAHDIIMKAPPPPTKRSKTNHNPHNPNDSQQQQTPTQATHTQCNLGTGGPGD